MSRLPNFEVLRDADVQRMTIGIDISVERRARRIGHSGTRLYLAIVA
jgi:hypothetical protein